MATLDTKTNTPILIPTGHSKYPFLIKTLDNKGINVYWLVKTDGTLSGDGFTEEEKEKYPQFLSNI